MVFKTFIVCLCYCSQSHRRTASTIGTPVADTIQFYITGVTLYLKKVVLVISYYL